MKKDNKYKEKKTEIKEELKTEKKSKKKEEEKSQEKAEEIKDQQKQKIVKKIQLTPQEAYKFFQDEQHKLEHLNNDLTKVEQAIFETDKTIFALKELKDSKGKEVFINFGNGIFAKAKIEDTKNFCVNTGTKAMIFRTTEKIISNLEKRKTSAIDSAKKLHQLQTQTQQNLNQLYKYLTQLQQKSQAKQDNL